MKRFSFFTTLSITLLMFGLSACTTETTDSTTETDTEATASDAPGPEVIPGTYTIDPVHSNMEFRARHLGVSYVDGRFTDVEGTVTLGEDLASMQTEATIQVNSIDTRNEDRDNHLRSPDFFDAANHPTITFTSTSVEPLGGGQFRMNGDLTIRGNTNPITLEGEYLGGVTGPQGNQIVAFTGEGEINRMNYGVSWDETLDTGGLIVGETIGLTVNVEAGASMEEGAAPIAGGDGAATAGCDGEPMGCDGEAMGCDGEAMAGCDGEPMGGCN